MVFACWWTTNVFHILRRYIIVNSIMIVKAQHLMTHEKKRKSVYMYDVPDMKPCDVPRKISPPFRDVNTLAVTWITVAWRGRQKQPPVCSVDVLVLKRRNSIQQLVVQQLYLTIAWWWWRCRDDALQSLAVDRRTASVAWESAATRRGTSSVPPLPSRSRGTGKRTLHVWRTFTCLVASRMWLKQTHERDSFKMFATCYDRQKHHDVNILL